MYVGKYDSIKKMKKTIGKDKGKKTDKISYWIKDLTDVLTIQENQLLLIPNLSPSASLIKICS